MAKVLYLKFSHDHLSLTQTLRGILIMGGNKCPFLCLYRITQLSKILCYWHIIFSQEYMRALSMIVSYVTLSACMHAMAFGT